MPEFSHANPTKATRQVASTPPQTASNQNLRAAAQRNAYNRSPVRRLVQDMGVVTEGQSCDLYRDPAYIEHAAEFFGFGRVAFGDDWPVSELATSIHGA